MEKLASFQTLEVLNYSPTTLKGKLDLAPTGDLGFGKAAVLYIYFYKDRSMSSCSCIGKKYFPKT